MGKSVGKILGIAAAVIGVAALIATGVGLFIAPALVTAALGGVSAAMLATAAAVLSVGASLLAPHPKAPTAAKATFDRLNVSVNVNEPRKAVFGNTAGALDMRDQEVEEISADDGSMNVHRWIVVAAHKASSIYEIWFEDEKVWTSAGGVVVGRYTGWLTVTAILEGTSANYINYGGRTTASARRFTGMAYVYLKFYINSESPFAQSLPTKMTVRMTGMPVYDPRKDTTAGGSGTQRANDCTTWQYNVSGNLQGDNPALQLLSWLLGWYIVNPSTAQRVLSVGRGIPAARFNMATFITAANICDETVTLAVGGSERRYRAAGVVSEAEDTGAASDRFKAAMGADLDDVDGQIRVTSFVNDLGAPVMTLTEDDILDAFEWKPSSNLASNFNIINGRYVSAADNALYQMVPYPNVTLPSRDGIDRTETVDYDMIQSQSQAERLTKMRLERAQFPGTFTAVFQFRAHRAQKGDIVSLTFGPLGFLNAPFRVMDKEYNGQGTVPMTLRLEDPIIYSWLNNDSAPVTYANPMVYSRTITPWQRMVTGQWQAPGQSGQVDSNLLRDNQFSATYWSRTSIGFCQRQLTNASLGGVFPVEGSQRFVAEFTLNHGVQQYTYNTRGLPTITPGRLYYVTFEAAKGASGVTGTATVRGTLTFVNSAGAVVGSSLNIDVTLAGLPAGGLYALQIGSMVAPAGAAKAAVQFGLLANTANGKVRINNPKLLDKEPGADITTAITGITSDTINYDYTGAAEAGELPFTYIYNLTTPAGNIGSGATWTYKVYSGGVNGFTSASGSKAMTGTGSASFTLNSLDTDKADVDMYAVYNGKTLGPYRLSLTKAVAAAPVSSGGGGGGGAGGSPTTQSSGFFGYSGTTFVTVTNPLAYTMPTGKTTAILSANLNGRPTTSGGVGDWVNQGKWQMETSPGSGTWTDVTASIATGNSEVIDTAAGEPGAPTHYVATSAPLTLTVNATGLTAGVAYNFRYVARVSSGGVRTHTVTGTASVTS